MLSGILKLLALFFTAPYHYYKKMKEELKQVGKDTGENIQKSDFPLLNILMLSGRVFVILLVTLSLIGILISLLFLIVDCIRIADYSVEEALGKFIIGGFTIFIGGIVGTFIYFWILGVVFEFLTLSIRMVNYLKEIRDMLKAKK